MENGNIKAMADELAEKYQTRDPFRVASELDMIVLYQPLKGSRGFCFYYEGQALICIEENLPEYQMAFECAHEMGHLLLQKECNAVFLKDKTFFCMDKYEHEADQFAMDLLISDDMLLEHRDFTVEQLSVMFGYEERLIRLRLKDLKCPERAEEIRD